MVLSLGSTENSITFIVSPASGFAKPLGLAEPRAEDIAELNAELKAERDVAATVVLPPACDRGVRAQSPIMFRLSLALIKAAVGESSGG